MVRRGVSSGPGAIPPESMMAAWKRPWVFPSYANVWSATLIAPADCPKIVTLPRRLRSAQVVLHPLERHALIVQPGIRRAIRDNLLAAEEAERSDAVADGDEHDGFAHLRTARHELARIVRGRAAGEERAAVDPHEHGQLGARRHALGTDDVEVEAVLAHVEARGRLHADVAELRRVDQGVRSIDGLGTCEAQIANGRLGVRNAQELVKLVRVVDHTLDGALREVDGGLGARGIGRKRNDRAQRSGRSQQPH